MRKSHDVTLLRARVSVRRGACGAKAPAAAVASYAAPGPHHRPPRTEPIATPNQREPVPSYPIRTQDRTGPDIALSTADPYWASPSTDRHQAASCKTPSDFDAGLPGCPLRYQFSTCSTGIFDYCHDPFVLNRA